MLSEVRWAGYTLGGSHLGLHGILAEQPPAADALQPALRSGFRAQLRRGVTPHNLERPAREEAIHETHAHYRHSLRRTRCTSGG